MIALLVILVGYWLVWFPATTVMASRGRHFADDGLYRRAAKYALLWPITVPAFGALVLARKVLRRP